MIAGIAADNDVSLRLHARLGFVETGRLPEVGRKFGRWLDLVFMQMRL
jgi:phosphinothricin acetyltransferase